MKRLLICLLCLMLLPLAALAEEEASWARVLPLVEAERGLTPADYEPYQIVGNEEEGWYFSLILVDHPEDEDGLLICQLSPEGELIVTGPEKISLQQQAHNALRACFDQEDCYMRLAQLVQDWADRHDELAPLSITTPAPMDNILLLDIRFPEAGSLPYLSALSAAQHCLLDLPGWSEDALAHFKVYISAYMVPKDIGKPVWLFVFSKKLDMTLEGDDFARALEDAYGYTINGEPAPVHFSVMVDSRTGDIVEYPQSRFDYVPATFTPTDYVIRPSWFLSYQDGGFG